MLEKWIEALESGQYQQGYKALYDSETDCYCALGVLCKIAGVSETQLDAVPVPAVTWTHLDQDLEDRIVFLNDVQKKNFLEIAAWIRQNLL